MLKNCLKRRIVVYSVALLIVGILYFFPSKNAEISKIINYVEVDKSPIYLINKDNYVVRTTFVSTKNDTLSKIKELINSLTIGNNIDTIPQNFKQIIPKNTRILSITLDNNLLKINFSKEFLDVTENNEEKLIEALVYTLTEIKEVKDIMIFIEDNKLIELPKSKIKLPSTLNRNFGINKVYDISSLKDSSKTTIYYVGKENDLTYYIPVTKIDNNKNNKIEIIIEELKSSPIYETNLMSYLASSVLLLNYETLENEIALSFNNDILNLNKDDILEEVKYSIALSLKDTLNIDNVIFKVNDKIIATFKES